MTLGLCSALALQLPPTLQKPVTPGSLSQPSPRRGIPLLPFRRRTMEMWTSFLLCRPGISQPTVSMLIFFYDSIGFCGKDSRKIMGDIMFGLFKISITMSGVALLLNEYFICHSIISESVIVYHA